jgi:hypothetical protein
MVPPREMLTSGFFTRWPALFPANPRLLPGGCGRVMGAAVSRGHHRRLATVGCGRRHVRAICFVHTLTRLPCRKIPDCTRAVAGV